MIPHALTLFGGIFIVLFAAAVFWCIYRKKTSRATAIRDTQQVEHFSVPDLSAGRGGRRGLTTPTFEEGDADPEAQALSASLRLGFGMLKVVMVLLTVAFFLSGVYWVEEGTLAVHVRFGHIIGARGQEVIAPGGPHFAFPAPVDTIVRIPSTLQGVTIDKAFWHQEQNPTPVPGQGPTTFLQAALLTGDRNIVHGRWAVTYQVDFDPQDPNKTSAPLQFVQHVGTVDRARQLVQDVVESSIVRVISQTPIDRFVKGRIDHNLVKSNAQDVLQHMQTGIKIQTLFQNEYTVPLSVLPYFQAVNAAESEKARMIEIAEQKRTQILHQAAGSGYVLMLQAIEAYEQARQTADASAIAAAEAQLELILDSPSVGGEVATIMNEAKQERTRLVEMARAREATFRLLLEQYRENPRILTDRLLQEAMEDVLGAGAEKLYLPADKDKTLYLDLDR